MSWSVVWSSVCKGDVRRIHWRTAERICAAVFEAAREGVGDLECRADHHRTVRIHTPGAVALVSLDPETATLTVQRILPEP